MPQMTAARLHSVMATPVHENGQAVGALTVGTYDAPREWDKPSQEVLKAFAEHVSLALTDARTLEAMNQDFHDSLTGLASRALFVTRMEESLAAGSLAVFFVDLDRFKVVNDSLGHAAGDRLLIGVAERIRGCLRDQDTAARLGGDEFAVLLPGVAGTAEVEPVAERILEALRAPFELGEAEAYLSSSVGIAFSEPGEHDAGELMVHADLAMHQAKKHGKDRFEISEETGMIVPIGEWVLREACRTVAAWNSRRSGKPLTVSVNVSAVQLDQCAIPRVVRSALDESGLPARCLVLELTESLLVDHRPATLDRLHEIKALGVRLAIDDFGTGYSSLAYLRRFPVDIIKIDKSFVDDVVDEPTAAALTHGIIQLGQALQLSTIAEGIEHAGQLTSLAGGNCELGQGYYFAEPLTNQALGELLFPDERD